MSLETSEFIRPGTQVSLRPESGTLFGGACVKHVARRGMHYVLGVQLGYCLWDDALALVREAYSTPRAQ